MLSGKHCSNNKNNTAITALHQQWPQNKSQTHQPVSGLPPTHQMHTMPPHPLCLKQLRQRARKVIFKTLSQHLTSHCFPHFCTDPNVNSKHLRVICCGHRERKFLGWRSMSHEYLCVTTHWSIIDMWCWIKTIWCCGNPPFFFAPPDDSTEAHREWQLSCGVNSPPQVTILNIHAVPLHNSPCQHTKEMTWRKRGLNALNWGQKLQSILNKLLFRHSEAEGGFLCIMQVSPCKTLQGSNRVANSIKQTWI